MQISSSFSNAACTKALNKASNNAVSSPVKNVNFKGICPDKIFQPTVVLDKYLGKSTVIDNAIAKNPNINEILIKNGINPKVNLKNITGASQNHFRTTYDAAMELANKNGIKGNDLSNLKMGSLLHDIGKSLIPVEIIDKPGKLDIREREIINLHSKLGAKF